MKTQAGNKYSFSAKMARTHEREGEGAGAEEEKEETEEKEEKRRKKRKKMKQMKKEEKKEKEEKVSESWAHLCIG